MNKTAAGWKAVSLRIIRQLSVAAIGIYLTICLSLALVQRRMIYFPQHFTGKTADAAAKAAHLDRWQDPSGQAIGLKRHSPRQPAVGQVLIFYGNASFAAGCAHYADELQKLAALDVFILEYPGYADRPGTPTEKNFFRAADQAQQLLAANLPIYLIGESLGSGVAAYLAGAHPDRISGIVLLSPYDRLASVGQDHFPLFPVRWMLLDQFASVEYLRHYHGPVAVVVDGCDTVAPEKFGLQLYECYAGPKRLRQFSNGTHITIMEPPERFWNEVLEFWKTNSPAFHWEPVVRRLSR
jgi:uncharacterized protein